MSIIKKFQDSGKYTKYSAIAIILFSIIVLSLASIYHVSGDGCWHMSVSRFAAEDKKIPLFEPLGREEPFWSPPLYHMTAASVYYVFSIFGHSAANFAVKFVSPIFGIMSLIASFLLIKKLYNSKIAFYSILFLAFIPIFMDYSVFSYAESMLVFFVILSIYFLVNDRIFLSGIAAGLSILTKYNGAFVLPVLIFILYRKGSKKEFFKNAAIIIALSLLIASPWLARNWALLGNPVWPFLNFAFNGYGAKSFSDLSLNNLIEPDLYAFTYLGIFGVPDGNYNVISFVNLPYLMLLLAIWLLATFIFAIPLAAGILNIRNIRKSFRSFDIMIALILSYLLLFFLYAVNVGISVSRMLLPAFPAFALLWAFGYDKLTESSKFKKAIFLTAIVIVFGFVLAEFVKIKIAADSWDFYTEDFEWARANTGKYAIFVAEGQCIPFNLERTSVYAAEENIRKADYIWINQNFSLDRRSALANEKLELIKSRNYNIAYENKKTGTMIYSTRKNI